MLYKTLKSISCVSEPGLSKETMETSVEHHNITGKRYSISIKMMLVFSLLTFSLLTVISLIGYFYKKNQIEGVILNELTLRVDNAAIDIESWFLQRKSVVDASTRMFEKRSTFTTLTSQSKALNPYLVLDKTKSVLDFLFIGTKDKLFYAGLDWLAPEGWDPTVRPWYKKARSSMETVFTEYYTDSNTKQFTMSIASPLIDEKGEFMGVLGTDIYLNEVIEKVSSLKLDLISTALIDDKGVAMSHQNPDLVNKNLMEIPELKPVISEMLQESKGHQVVKLGGVEQLMIYSSIPSLDWKVVFFVDTKLTNSSLMRLRLFYFGLMVVSVMATLLLSRYIAQRIAKRVFALADSINVIASGKLELDFSKEGLDINDEIGDLVISLASMVDKLKAKVDLAEAIASQDLSGTISLDSDEDVLGIALQKMNNNLNEILSGMNESSGQVSISSKELAASAQQLASGSSEQAASLEETSSSLSEVESQTKSNSDSALQVRQLTEQTLAVVENSNDQMKEMLSSMSEINTTSADVSKIIKVIDEIAFQTNLLALNAAVEAARAGKYGKGFAVVAEEVRSLAARSAEAAKSTTELIDNSTRQVEKGVENADKTAEMLREISEAVAKINDSVAEIAIASGEQTKGIAEINQGMNQVNNIVQQNSSISEETASASEQLSAQADVMRDIIGRFKLKQLTKKISQQSIENPPKPVVPVKAEPQIEAGKDLPVVTKHKSRKTITLDDSEFGRF